MYEGVVRNKEADAVLLAPRKRGRKEQQRRRKNEETPLSAASPFHRFSTFLRERHPSTLPSPVQRPQIRLTRMTELAEPSLLILILRIRVLSGLRRRARLSLRDIVPG